VGTDFCCPEEAALRNPWNPWQENIFQSPGLTCVCTVGKNPWQKGKDLTVSNTDFHGFDYQIGSIVHAKSNIDL